MPFGGTKSDTLGLCVGPAFKTLSNGIVQNESRSVHDAPEFFTHTYLQQTAVSILKGGHPCVA
jgi:hypothetical protein